MGHARHQRAEAAFLLRFRSRQRDRAHRAAVECAEEGDNVLALGVIARELQGALDGLSARVSVVELVGPCHGRQLGEAIGQLDHAGVIEVGARHVDQLGSLLLDGFDHVRMAVPGGSDGDSGGDIEELVAVHIFDDKAASALRHHGVGTRIGRRDQAFITLEYELGIGAGQGRLNLGSGHGCGPHGNPPSGCLVSFGSGAPGLPLGRCASRD